MSTFFGPLFVCLLPIHSDSYPDSFLDKSAANPDLDFSFITIRLAGYSSKQPSLLFIYPTKGHFLTACALIINRHMVPAFQPGPAQSFFEKFISGEGF